MDIYVHIPIVMSRTLKSSYRTASGGKIDRLSNIYVENVNEKCKSFLSAF